MSKITDIVAAMARPVVEEEGCTLWDVEYVREAGTWYLRVLIDRNGELDIADCERISRRLDPMLDEADPIADSYVFEVGSAGLERELKRPSDFEQYMGSSVELRLYKAENGQRAFVGTLTGYDNGNVTVTVGNDSITFEKSKIALVKLHAEL